MYLSTEHETIESVYAVTVKYRDLSSVWCSEKGKAYREVTLSHTTLYRASTQAMAICHAVAKYAENHDIEVKSVTANMTELVTC